MYMRSPCMCMMTSCLMMRLCGQIGEEETRSNEKMVWDGHSASMEKVSQKARENISVEQQIANIHKSKGLV